MCTCKPIDALGAQRAGYKRLQCLVAVLLRGCAAVLRGYPTPIDVHVEVLAVTLLVDDLPVGLLDASRGVRIYKGKVSGLIQLASPGRVGEV